GATIESIVRDGVATYGNEIFTFEGTIIADKNLVPRKKDLNLLININLGDRFPRRTLGVASFDLGYAFTDKKVMEQNLPILKTNVLMGANVKILIVSLELFAPLALRPDERVINHTYDDDEGSIATNVSEVPDPELKLETFGDFSAEEIARLGEMRTLIEGEFDENAEFRGLFDGDQFDIEKMKKEILRLRAEVEMLKR
ncbi:MAG: hypothetical protein EZS28_055533, partial [Streblomastix strix]